MSNDWKLESLDIQFKKGFSFENTTDRYEGRIKFSNGDGEHFLFKIDQVKCDEFIKLISKEIVNTADSLSDRLLISLNLKNQQE